MTHINAIGYALQLIEKAKIWYTRTKIIYPHVMVLKEGKAHILELSLITEDEKHELPQKITQFVKSVNGEAAFMITEIYQEETDLSGIGIYVYADEWQSLVKIPVFVIHDSVDFGTIDITDSNQNYFEYGAQTH